MTSAAENLDAVTRVTENPLPAGGNGWAIKATNLSKVYGADLVVDHLNLAIPYGELYALLGDNGAGKTTTINMLTTLTKPSSGEIEICGSNLIEETERTKRAFGIVSQDIALYQELTAFENLWFIAQLYGLPRKKALESIERLLEQSGLTERANDIAGTFSGGMQRKLTIACALLHEPKVLFMDEPTVGLDPASRRQIWQTLRGLRHAGVTILLTTHYLEEAELLADRIGIIRQGKMAIEGSIEHLRQKIQGMRSIAIRLTPAIDPDALKTKLDKLSPRLSKQVKFDPLRSTLSFAQPKDGHLANVISELLAWLEQEKIPFTRCATSEPNLEEVFLALSGETSALDSQPLSEDDSFEHDYT